MKLFILFLLVIHFCFSDCFGQAGILDSTFGINGTSLPYFPTHSPISIAIEDDGKILTCGYYSIITDCGLTRYKQNGTPDSSFGSNGKALSIGNLGNLGRSVVTQQDGKIVVCSGNSDFEIARYLTNGSPDLLFGGGGKVTYSIPGTISSDAYSVLVQPDGKIVVSGTAVINNIQSIILIARLNDNGTLDNTFGTNGVTTTLMGQSAASGISVARQNDGKLVVGGYSISQSYVFKFALVRYNTNGVLDNAFGNGGKVEPFLNDINHPYDFCNSIVLQNDGKILMAGATADTQDQFAVLRINTDGSIDSSFGNNGIVKTDFFPYDNLNEASDVTIQQDGKIIVVGYAYLDNSTGYNNAAMARYNTNGTLDSSYGQNGKIVIAIDSITGFAAAAMQPDGKIVVAGVCETLGQLVWRFLSGLDIGVIDTSNPNNPILIYPNPIHSQATLQYTLSKDEQITIELFDIQGKVVQQFFTNETRTKGKHEEVLCFNEYLPAGNYILNISNGRFKQGVKIVLH